LARFCRRCAGIDDRVHRIDGRPVENALPADGGRRSPPGTSRAFLDGMRPLHVLLATAVLAAVGCATNVMTTSDGAAGAGASDTGATASASSTTTGASGSTTSASSSSSSGAACTWPASADTAMTTGDAGQFTGCLPDMPDQICQETPPTTTCMPFCPGAEYELTCVSAMPADALGCKINPISTPFDTIYYCCPCMP
jgi:hypothetical protein